jgi:rhodanese-related sulfurtransferase
MNVQVTKEIIDNEQYTVVDIRTKGEWMESGVVKDSHLIPFWDEMGQYDAEGFIASMKELEKHGKEIALICRTGNRTGQVAGFLNQQGMNIKSLNGGVMMLGQQGYSFTPYNG